MFQITTILKNISWRWLLALTLFTCAMLGLSSGVGLTERPDVVEGSLLAKAYYSLGLFVVGGLDIGLPTGGPQLGRVLLWIAYFGSPPASGVGGDGSTAYCHLQGALATATNKKSYSGCRLREFNHQLPENVASAAQSHSSDCN